MLLATESQWRVHLFYFLGQHTFSAQLYKAAPFCRTKISGMVKTLSLPLSIGNIFCLVCLDGKWLDHSPNKECQIGLPSGHAAFRAISCPAEPMNQTDRHYQLSWRREVANVILFRRHVYFVYDNPRQ
jgi:hypothetical protein